MLAARRENWHGAVLLSIVTVCAVSHGGHTDATSFALAQRLASASNFAPSVAKARPALTVQQMAVALRDGGMPISAIAEAVGVERKTIYSWLNGAAEVRGPNAQRMAQVHALMTAHPDAEVRQISRFWNSPVAGQRTLRDLMTATVLDEADVRRAIDGIRPAARRAAESERRMVSRGGGNPIMEEVPEASAGR